MSQRLTQGNPEHEGFQFVRTIIGKFEIIGTQGAHICLVYEPMRETLNLFRMRLKEAKFTLPLLKAYLRLLLRGLDYLHSECRMVHTGKHLILHIPHG